MKQREPWQRIDQRNKTPERTRKGKGEQGNGREGKGKEGKGREGEGHRRKGQESARKGRKGQDKKGALKERKQVSIR